MTTYSKPTVRSAWGQTATGADLQDPGDTYASAGWQIGVKPPRQYFNWVLNYTFSGVRYLCQQGIPTWDSTESYSVGSYTIGPNGSICRSLINNNVNQNPNNTTGTAWDVAYVNTAPLSDTSGRITNTAWVRGYALPIGSSFTAINGSIQNSQVPVGAVTQWQGSLSISGGQVTSAVSGANTLLINGGYRSITWSGQSGQPSWLIGSSDGVNFLVWNPANFNVANANTVAGLGVTSAAAGNTVMARDANGYAYAVYLNQASSNNENPSISQFMVTNGVDSFFRKASVAAVQAALGALTTANFPALLSGNGYQRFPSGVILQWGEAFISGATTVTFPIAFPTNSTSVVFTNISSTNQIFLNGAPLGKTSFSATNGNSTVSWMAVGY